MVEENQILEPKQKAEILTLRIPSRLKQNIINIKNKMHSKLSRISQNFLNLSEIMIVREDNTKIGWDNDSLSIFPETIVQYIFNILKNEANKFEVWANLGDELGKYLNNIFSLKSLSDDDYIEMFETIKHLGWFNYTSKNTHEGTFIFIPKKFGNKALVYSMVYRILTKTKFPPDWDYDLLNADDKQQKKDNYKTIKEILHPDIKEQNKMNFYFFKKLKIKPDLSIDKIEK